MCSLLFVLHIFSEGKCKLGSVSLVFGNLRYFLSFQIQGHQLTLLHVFQEVHALRIQLEAAKYDVIKYCIGTLVSMSAVGLAVVRILL